MDKILKKLKVLFIPCEENKYKPRFLESQVLFYWILGLLILKLIAVSFLVCFPKTVFFADLTKTALVQLTNQERQTMGLPILKENPVLNQAAYEKAQDMLAQDYFSHQSPTGLSPWHWFQQAGYKYQLAGENLAVGFLDSEEVVKAWLNSPSHKANLVNTKFQETGMAVVKGEFQGAETTVVVQLFGAPLSQKTATITMKPKAPETKVVTEKPAEITPSQTPPQIQQPEVTEASVVPEKEVVAGVSEFQLTASQSEVKEEQLSFNFFKFMSLDYPDILQKIIFYSLLLITLALILNIFIKIHIQDKRLILKTAFFLILLIVFVWSDKELIIQLIPHNLLI